MKIDRVLDRLDALLAAKNYTGAEAHLLFWLREAEACGDAAAELTVLNELMGFYRKQGDRAQATKYANYALDRYGIDPGYNGTVFFATTCLNAATVCEAFGENDRALGLYRRCESIYEQRLEPDDLRFAGLLNNMGLALIAASQYDSAFNAFMRAIQIQEPLGVATAPDRAVTYLNLCDLIDAGYLPAETGLTEPADLIDSYIESAYALLTDPQTEKNAYYAFVCEKCAPVFGYYGYFLYKQRITAEAEKVNVQYSSR